MKIGITGSLASGKTTASRILSQKKWPLFSADIFVNKLYTKKKIQNKIYKMLKIKDSLNFKSVIKKLILNKKLNIMELEKIIHPLVRKGMQDFTARNKNKKFIFFEIPLLIESKLMKKFDLIFFIKANKKLRLKRFKLKGGNEKLFHILNKKQLYVNKKIKYCDYVIVNEKNFDILKTRLLSIFKKYE